MVTAGGIRFLSSKISTAQHWAAQGERILDLLWVRLALSLTIIVSLIPVPWVEQFDGLFLAIFGSEFSLRLFALLVRPRQPAEDEGLGGRTRPSPVSGRGRLTGLSLLMLDALALISFLPISSTGAGARWLRLFRLTRMLLLVGYWAPLVRDLWSILLRRERARQLMLMGFVVGGLSFAGAVLLYYLGMPAMDVNDDGLVSAADRSFPALLWWSFRQVQDPGNMLASPHGVPVVVVSLLLTVFGLFLVSFLIGLGTDVVRELLELSRLRPPGLRGHTVLVNITPSTRRVLHELRRYYRKLVPSDARVFSWAWFGDLRRRGFGSPRYVIVGNPAEPPEFLRQPDLSSIVYRQRPDDEEELIVRSDLLTAKRILMLADHTDSFPDAETIRTLVTLVERLRDGERRRGRLPGRQRVVIAEILDESNVPAAQAALATGRGRLRGFVVPTEKLLALFFAAVVRRPGLGELLEELLTSHGHEIYTCFFDARGLGFKMEDPPDLGDDAPAVMQRLLDRGMSRAGAKGRVVPLGVLVDRPGRVDHGGRDFDVWVNPRANEEPNPVFRGFVGIADNFRSIWTLAQGLDNEAQSSPDPEPEPYLPTLARTHRHKTTRVLVCGFRPGSIYMLEELFRSDPGGKVLVLVETAAMLERALEAFDAHSQLVRHGLIHAQHAVFEPQPDGTLVVHLAGESQASVMHLRVADWMASRHLVELPAGYGHAADLEAIVFVASTPEDSDKRTTTALLKLEQLFVDRKHRPRVVAEVIDGKLATRLEQRYQELGVTDTRVFSIQELRAYFLFQSVVVPGFDTVYAELLGSWGQSFVHKHVVHAEPEADSDAEPQADPDATCSFRALAEQLWGQGELLIAVELAAPGSPKHILPRLCVAPCGGELGDRFCVRELRGVWVIAPDHQA